MIALEMRGLGVAFATTKPVLKDVDVSLAPGFYGLVGANGAGKTTLLRALAGELAYEGTIQLRPAGATITYCPQKVDEITPDVIALASSFEGIAAELRGRLALEPAEIDHWPTLSPGERKRWQIAAALAQEPEVLLLDEPTNHLDAEARNALLGALRRFRGIGVIVSHDRTILEALPRAILRVHDAEVTVHAGRYSDARAAWEHTRKEREQAHFEAKAEVRALERRADVAQRTQEATSRGMSTRARMRNKNDSDARGIGAANLASWADARAGRSAAIVRASLDRARDEVPPIERDRTVGGKVFAAFERAPNAALFHLDEPELRAGDHVVFRDVRLTIARDERVRIAGPNGAGKTTLLGALCRRRDRILYLPQELEPEAIAALWEALHSSTEIERGRVLAIFAALGSDPERVLASHVRALSPGEARKLALAIGLGRHVWALVLDEPTNHLDLPTIERLEGALASYPGCLVIVTHDESFASATTTRTLRVEHGVVV